MLVTIPLLAALSIGGWPDTFPHFRAIVAIDRAVPTVVASSAIAEAGAIWARYGIAIAEAISSRAGDPVADNADAVFFVRADEAPPAEARAWASPFASIRLGQERSKGATISLRYNTVLSAGLDTATLNGVRVSQWPRAVRNEVLGRMIGRVLAHEIGHWLLGSATHAPSGLMRAVHTTDVLAAADRTPFYLSREEVARLRTALAH